MPTANDERLTANDQQLPLVIKPEFYRHVAAGIFWRQGAEGIDALNGAHRRNVERRNSAGLLDLHIRRMTVACDVERDVDTVRFFDARIDFVLQPILGHLALYRLHIPGEAAAEIAASARESESAFGASGVEHAIRATDRAAFAVRNLIRFLRLSFRLALGGGLDRRGFYFCLRALVGNRNRFRFFLLGLRLAVREPLGFSCQHIVCLLRVGGERDGTHERRSHGVSASASAPALASEAGNERGVKYDEH